MGGAPGYGRDARRRQVQLIEAKLAGDQNQNGGQQQPEHRLRDANRAVTVAALQELERGEGEVVDSPTSQLFDGLQ